MGDNLGEKKRKGHRGERSKGETLGSVQLQRVDLLAQLGMGQSELEEQGAGREGGLWVWPRDLIRALYLLFRDQKGSCGF